METIQVVNIKCGGCERGITDALTKKGLTHISVSAETQEVSFEGSRDVAIQTLAGLGYPQAGTPEAESVLKKAQSYKTCAVGTVTEGTEDATKRTKKFWMLIAVPVIALMACGAGLYALVHNSVRFLPEAVPTPLVTLHDGDTYNLTAAYVRKDIDGVPQTMLAYNDSIPGPTIHVQQGSTITIHFTNNTDLPTLLHSHGVRMDNAFDGSQLVQKEMQPGESFDYVLTFPDPGIYWYHPHAQEVYTQGMGLYGAFVVEPTDSNYFPAANKEQVLFLSDLSMRDGVIDLPKRSADHSLMGHYGNVMFTNGETAYSYTATAGEVVRLYVVNAANARTFNFGVQGARMKLVGGDNGAYEQSKFVDNVVLGPSERAIVDVLVPAAGEYQLVHTTPSHTYTLGKIVATPGTPDTSLGQPFNTLTSNQATTTSMQQARAYAQHAPDKNLLLTVSMGGMGGMNHMGHMMGTTTPTSDGIEWEDTMPMMNTMSTPDMVTWTLRDSDTGKENMDIDWRFTQGSFVKVRIVNDPHSAHPMQHPIHFHGQRFIIVARNGVPQTNLVWKDTALVRAGETVDVVVQMSNPGAWMTHCHISEHLESGMMLPFVVQ